LPKPWTANDNNFHLLLVPSGKLIVTITISQADYCQLWQQGTQNQPTDDFLDCITETVEVCPPEFGAGSKRWVTLREIDLLIHDYELHHDVEIQYDSSEGGLEFGFQLQGGSYAQRCAGQNFIQDGPQFLEIVHERAGERILQVDLHLESVDCLKRFLPGDVGKTSLQVQQLIQGSSQQPYKRIDRTTPAMQAILKQMLHCPFRGLTRQIYLEGKCWELIAFKLDQLSAESSLPAQKNLDRDDIDRIHEAKAILTRNWQTPPSLLELARQVGLNDYKLKLGFRQVFGTTAFDYLWHYRMEQARQLLTEGPYNIKEVSILVGYTKQSNFAVAFRKKYGVNPKTYQLTVKKSADQSKKSV
jgi:AraC family transcriptional regulator, transcriptional activator of the genes for pyochelin and ferripyochelin receptors